MPIYEYECGSCGHRLEAMQKLADAPLTDCPDCNKPSLNKLISAVGFRLSGGGWYETDFKSDNKRNLVESDKAKPKDKSEKKSGESSPAAASTASCGNTGTPGTSAAARTAPDLKPA